MQSRPQAAARLSPPGRGERWPRESFLCAAQWPALQSRGRDRCRRCCGYGRFPPDRMRRKDAAARHPERRDRGRECEPMTCRSAASTDDLHHRVARAVANGVADHVFNGAPQQLRIAFHHDRLAHARIAGGSRALPPRYARRPPVAAPVRRAVSGRAAASWGRPPRASPASSWPTSEFRRSDSF